jgi:hypothetical protein
VSGPLEFLRSRALWLLCRVSPRKTVMGIEVVDLSAGKETQEFFNRTDAALSLIAATDATRFRRVRRDLRRMILVPGGGQFYQPGLRAYAIDEATLHRSSTISMAVGIVHEATHARMWNRGIRYGHDARGRVEAACVRAEVAFAQRLPDSEALVRSIKARLDSPWWTEKDLKARRIAQLRTGLPEWMVRIYQRVTGT